MRPPGGGVYSIDDALELRPPDLRGSVLDVLQLQEELVGTVIGRAAVLTPIVAQDRLDPSCSSRWPAQILDQSTTPDFSKTSYIDDYHRAPSTALNAPPITSELISLLAADPSSNGYPAAARRHLAKATAFSPLLCPRDTPLPSRARLFERAISVLSSCSPIAAY